MPTNSIFNENQLKVVHVSPYLWVWGTPFGSRGFPSTRFKRFDVFDNFVSIIMKSNTITSQTLIFFPKNGWIILLWGNSMDVKQLDVPI